MEIILGRIWYYAAICCTGTKQTYGTHTRPICVSCAGSIRYINTVSICASHTHPICGFHEEAIRGLYI